MKLKILFCFFLITLTACGFHLRGYGDLPPGLQRLNFQYQAQNTQWKTPIQKRLRHMGVLLSENAPVTLVITKIEDEKSIASYNPQGKVAEYALRRSLTFTLKNQNGRTLHGPRTISRERVYAFDSENIGGKGQEERLLLNELKSEILNQLVFELQRINL